MTNYTHKKKAERALHEEESKKFVLYTAKVLHVETFIHTVYKLKALQVKK